jgi:D-3-phosphoglycerate dehydrogenase
MQIGIIEPQDFSLKALTLLSDLGNVSKFESGTIEDFLVDKEIVFVRLNYYLDTYILSNANKLKYICTPTTGLNHLDLDYLNKNKIKVISLKGEFDFLSDIRATSEHTFGLILSLLRNYKNAISTTKENFSRDLYKGDEIFNNSIGIIGFGRIGKLLAKYIEAFNGNCFFYDVDTTTKEIYGAKRLDSVEELISTCNVITLCASYELISNKFFNKTYIDLLKNKFFINTSRGELIDEKYLLKKIKEKYFKGIAIDVIQDESKENNNLDEFLNIDKSINFIITPHIAGATYTSMKRTEVFITKKIISILKLEGFKK